MEKNNMDDYMSDYESTQKSALEIELEKTTNDLIRTFKIIGVLIAALILFCSFTVVTQKNEFSVIKQFGSIVRIEKEAGLSFKIPFIQSVSKIDNTMLYYDLAKSDVITSDKKTMIVDSYVIWRVVDPEKYMKTLSGSNTNAEGRLNTVVYNAVKNTISGMTQDEVIVSRDGKVNVSVNDKEENTNDLVVDESENQVVQIKSLTEEITSNLADTSDYGIEIVKTEVKVLDLPDANKDAVYQRMISERSNVAASYEAQGKSEAQVITNTTDKEVSIMLANAKAEAEKIIAEGESEYMKILSEAYNDPAKSEFYSFVRALDTAKEALKNNGNTLILDPDSPIAQIFYNKK